MIIIKDKTINSQIFLPRYNISPEDGTNEQIVSLEKRVSDIEKNYATQEYVNEIINEINNALEDIIG